MDSSKRHSALGSNRRSATMTVKSETLSNGDDLDAFGSETDAHGITFRPKQCLPKPSVQNIPIKDLMHLLDGPYLELSPEYQREVVWPDKKMSGLINSILENFYIPPVIFNKTQVFDDDGTVQWKRVCVDGKQRLSSMKAFVEGEIPCHDKNGRKWYFRQQNNVLNTGKRVRPRTRQILPDEVQKGFLEKEVVCVETTGLRRDQEEDLFSRVQLGVPLSIAEKIRATSGRWQELARLFEEDFKEIAEREFI
jgi:Protein of unknown function DUF262